jgi:hypothetical protein
MRAKGLADIIPWGGDYGNVNTGMAAGDMMGFVY